MDRHRSGARTPPDAGSDTPAAQGPRAVPDASPPQLTVGPFLEGRLLIAMPGIGDQRFERAVLMVCVHNDEHAMALGVNRPMKGLTTPSLLRRLEIAADNVPEQPVMLGGPCGRDRGYVLHTDDYWSPGSSLRVAEGIALTDTREVLDALGDPVRRPRRSLLALGYAGWGPGQLEDEIRQGVWLTCEPDEALLFGEAHDDKWSSALAQIGVSADRLSSQAGRA